MLPFNFQCFVKSFHIIGGAFDQIYCRIHHSQFSSQIKIIINSKNPKDELIKKYKLKEMQVNAILDMKLRSLRKIEQKNVQNELSELKGELKF